jgi:hypothetical protein
MGVIYEILNSVTGASYIGSTKQCDPCSRWAMHLCQLRNKKHPSIRFQISWDSSVLTDWTFRILENNIDPNELFQREQFYVERDSPILNGKSRVTKAIRKDYLRKRVTELLQSGISYRKIAAEVGCSLGWITHFKRYGMPY